MCIHFPPIIHVVIYFPLAHECGIYCIAVFYTNTVLSVKNPQKGAYPLANWLQISNIEFKPYTLVDRPM